MNTYNCISWIIYSSINGSILVMGIFLLRHILKNRLQGTWNYYMWFLLIIRLISPYGFTKSFNLIFVMKNLLKNTYTKSSQGLVKTYFKGNNSGIRFNDMTKDYALSINKKIAYFNMDVLFSLWLIGAIIFFMIFIYTNIKSRKKYSSANVVKDNKILDIFKFCKEKTKVKSHLKLIKDDKIYSPMIYGIFKAYLILPERELKGLEEKDIRNIMLHEMVHYKSKDILVNIITTFIQIVHWFNPIIWIGFAKMRKDREIACDTKVLSYLESWEHKEYGETIIKLLRNYNNTRIETSFSVGFLHNRAYLKERINNIVSFKNRSKKRILVGSMAIFLLANVFLCDGKEKFNYLKDNIGRIPKNYEYEHVGKYFNGYEGTFVLYDMKNDKYHIYNESLSKKRVSPLSTFKIGISLVGLEEGIIKDENMIIPWNKEIYPFEEWNKDQNLKTAMKYSVNWYYEAVSSRIGHRTMKKYVDKMKYGNKFVSNNITRFWNESSLKISPIEQISFLRDFYAYKLPFSKENLDRVKEVIKVSKNNRGQLSGKTGTANVNNKNINGWFIGYVEKDDNTYFFATNINAIDKASGSAAKHITLSILKEKGIY
ncbi:BlaR1 family beta-lactam sensor/signal transducer [Marinisporobacter balticus]|uniref:Bla regulator protein BlaR1 n=1 Tax=Marinisporobacter balticus TaxID=2018667 RepID=A0A4R2K754_9FIRM|nr:BlaR1 family beta-lactam sensor/signal transducer [Marinisporobacter balticus]TCO69153.1 bla regulator protein BlaR1 [Marinisporobacter balticus]